MKKHFRSNGKLLISGEYVVLDGADALAIPTKKGQSLTVENTEKDTISWKSFKDSGELWLDFDVAFAEIKNWDLDQKPQDARERLIQILAAAKKLNPQFLTEETGINIETKLEFPQFWGLGSSSTLINNVASWAEVNAFHLLDLTFGGSGYDIACAGNDNAIFYTKVNGEPIVKETTFFPLFADELYFIHLNQKMNSREGIAHYRQQPKERLITAIEQISAIGRKMQACDTLSDFENLIAEHETITSALLNIQPIKERLFKDYNGAIKSLGAWGGDFILATRHDALEYFKKHGYHTIVPFMEMKK